MIGGKKKGKKVQFHKVEKKKFNNAKKYILNKSLNNVSCINEGISPKSHKEINNSVGSIILEELVKSIEDKFLITDNKIDFVVPKKLRSTNKVNKVKFCEVGDNNKKKKGQKRLSERSPHFKHGKKNRTQNIGDITYNSINCKTINKNISNRNNNNDKIRKSKSFNINNKDKLKMNTSKIKEKKIKKKKKETKDKEGKAISEDTQDKGDTQNIVENVKHKCFCCL